MGRFDSIKNLISDNGHFSFVFFSLSRVLFYFEN